MKRGIIVIFVLLAGLFPRSSWGQYIYFSQYPGACWMDFCCGGGPFTTYIYVHAPESGDISGGRFRFESEFIEPDEILSIEPGIGVTIVEGNIFQELTLSWSSLDLTHYPVLTITLGDFLRGYNVQSNQDDHFCIRDAVLISSGGDIAIDDVCTWIGNYDCFDCYIHWYRPDTVDVVIGTSSIVEIIWIFPCGGFTGANIDIVDEEGWVSNWDPLYVTSSCGGGCPWNLYNTMEIFIEVPESTPDHELSRIAVNPVGSSFGSDSTSFFLRAIPPISAENRTWSGIKRLFR
jgi:hypothetical protein